MGLVWTSFEIGFPGRVSNVYDRRIVPKFWRLENCKNKVTIKQELGGVGFMGGGHKFSFAYELCLKCTAIQEEA